MSRLNERGERRVTMSDVANLAQCSQSTVSVVLNPNSKVKISRETRERILKAAEELGYSLEHASLSRSAPSRRIAVVFDDLTVCPEAVIAVDGVREFTWNFGDIVSAYNCHADPLMEERTLDAVLRSNPAAIIYSTVRTRAIELPRVLYDTDVPVILLNCYSKDHKFPSVLPANVAGGARATEILIAAGHRRIAHITGEEWMEVSKGRLRGYRDALATADLAFDPQLVREGNWQLGSGYEATKALMRLPRPPTAIFCGNDAMAVGCYEALKELGLSIPGDVSVVGFNDDDIAAQVMPKLTTLNFPRHQMGVWAAEQAIAGPRVRSAVHRVVKIECELVERESVAPPPGAAVAPKPVRTSEEVS